MKTLLTPRGLTVNVPENESEDPSPKYAIADIRSASDYYNSEGYVVIQGLVPDEDCEKIKAIWEDEVKKSRAFIYRQATAQAEKHAFNDKGWVMNPILNIQSVDPQEFSNFREFGTVKILTNPSITKTLKALLDDDPIIVQSMYFEGNSATWEHQDTYYLDSEKIGSMTAAWIALENIAAEAGRFFVCAKSHKIDMGQQAWCNNIADNHDAYIESVVKEIRKQRLEIRAPKLDKGDVLFWNARTIHGALNTQDEYRTRQSVTLHAIPARYGFLQLQNRLVRLKLHDINGTLVHHPKDLATFSARLVLWLESHFPKMFYAFKRFGVLALLGINTILNRSVHRS